MPHTRPAADVCAQNAAYNDYDIVSLTRARSHGEACKQRAEDARARVRSACNVAILKEMNAEIEACRDWFDKHKEPSG